MYAAATGGHVSHLVPAMVHRRLVARIAERK
jgi:hypothetical protein